jgi:L-threonylcarbamoyladenylate synthase
MTGTDLNLAAQLLLQGKLVAIPTETVYGLAANALDEVAVAHIFQVKNRPTFDPLIVHFPDFQAASGYCTSIPEAAEALAAAYMPGPLTLLLPKSAAIPDLVTASSPLVGVRVPSHAMCHRLLTILDFPLAAPSANPFGYISPTTATHVADQLGDGIDYILDGGPCQVGLESTIVGFPEGGAPTIFRKGGIPVEAIERCIGRVAIRPFSSSNPVAPGMLQVHYAPRAPMVLGELGELIARYGRQRAGLISFRKKWSGLPANLQVILSEKGDFAEAAKNLFAGMRYLDTMDLDVILAELLPEIDLGRAINDRLRRAAAKAG